MGVVRDTLDAVLRGHEPYPAVVIDRHRGMVAANSAVALLTQGVAKELLEPPDNVLRLSLHPGDPRPAAAVRVSASATGNPPEPVAPRPFRCSDRHKLAGKLRPRYAAAPPSRDCTLGSRVVVGREADQRGGLFACVNLIRLKRRC